MILETANDVGGAWVAFVGALIGGGLTFAGSLAVELRRDRRRQIGAARLFVGELRRAYVELKVLAEAAPKIGWHEGPHHGIRSDVWRDRAAEFVGALSPRDFDTVDRTAEHLRQAGELGATPGEVRHLIEQVEKAEEIIERRARPTWFDRHVWQL